MGDILIKNMEMPKDNTYILLSPEDGLVLEKIGSMYHVTTSFVEVKPHGRLVDADLLKESIKGLRLEKKLKDGAVQTIDLEELFNKYLDDAPTVLEASN